jgi:hypothetical protein
MAITACAFLRYLLQPAQQVDRQMISLPNPLYSVIHCWRERLSCGNESCAGAPRMWKRVAVRSSRTRIQGREYCFPDCFEHELQRRFVALCSRRPGKPQPRHRIPLGLLMLSRGDIDSFQLRAALAWQLREGPLPIGECMQRLGFARERQVTAALAAQWASPVLASLPGSQPACAVPFRLLVRFRMVPVSYIAVTRMLHLAFDGAIEYPALLAIEQALSCRTEACVCSRVDFEKMLPRFEKTSRLSDREFDLSSPVEMTRITSNYAAALSPSDVRLAAGSGFVWARIEGTSSMNLVFNPPSPTGPTGAT